MMEEYLGSEDPEITSVNNLFTVTYALPPNVPGFCRRTSSNPIFDVKFICSTTHEYINKSSCDSAIYTLLNYHEEPTPIELDSQFDLTLLRNRDELAAKLGPVLKKFEITEDCEQFGEIVSRVQQFMGPPKTAGKKRIPGTFSLKVIIHRQHYMFRCEACLVRLAQLAASMAAEENVRVPASEFSIKKMLKKRARVEEGESCSVCLEEFGRSYEPQMPCSHVFHRDCIETWLRESHFCPLCRFEMPISEEDM